MTDPEEQRRIENDKARQKLAELERRLSYFRKRKEDLPIAIESIDREFSQGKIAIDEYDALIESHLNGRSLEDNLKIFQGLIDHYSDLVNEMKSTIDLHEIEDRQIKEEQRLDTEIKELSQESRKAQVAFIIILITISVALFLAVDYTTTGYVIGKINETLNSINISLPIAFFAVDCMLKKIRSDENER